MKNKCYKNILPADAGGFNSHLVRNALGYLGGSNDDWSVELGQTCEAARYGNPTIRYKEISKGKFTNQKTFMLNHLKRQIYLKYSLDNSTQP